MNILPPTPPKDPNRRTFLGTVAAVAAGVAAVAGFGQIGRRATASTSEFKGKRRLTMVIDLTRCTGCNACAVACKSEFNVRLGAFRSWVNQAEKGTYPDTKRFFAPRLCNQCEESSCSLVCPTGATYEREDGIVMIDKDKCIGCRYCMNACPYGSRYFNWTNEPSEDMARTSGVVDKCDFCVHRVDKGLVPSCVNACPAQARIFGDMNDPDCSAYKLINTHATRVLLPERGTKPQVYYIGLDESVVKGQPQGGR